MNLRDLRKLNFHELITVSVPNVGSYTFEEYRNRNYEHFPISGYCVSCEQQGWGKAVDDEAYSLTNISHGAHASDFFLSLKERIDVSSPKISVIRERSENRSRIYR